MHLDVLVLEQNYIRWVDSNISPAFMYQDLIIGNQSVNRNYLENNIYFFYKNVALRKFKLIANLKTGDLKKDLVDCKIFSSLPSSLSREKLLGN